MSGPRQVLTRDEWTRMARHPFPPLLALWADTRDVYALLRDEQTALLVSTAVEDGGYPALSPQRPAAARFERMVRDLWGHVASDGVDSRPWLDHGHWPASAPMAPRPGPPARPEPPRFPTSGNLDRIPLGPVRGGIEPAAHLRLTGRGEAVRHLEVHLGYTHRGILTLMRGKSPRAAARFAARLAGQATVAHATAFARATEAALGCEAPPRAVAWRGVMAELERIACHLEVLAGVAEAAALAALVTRCARHVEAFRGAADTAFGHRLMMDCVVPGGVAVNVAPGGEAAINRALAGLTAEFATFQALPAAADLAGRGFVTPALAESFGVRAGDADQRMHDRLAAIEAGVRLVGALLETVPDGPLSVTLPPESGEAMGFADGPSGDIWHWLRLDHGQIANVFMRDPDWAAWPLAEAVVAGGRLEDVPLVLASFGLSSAGVDL